MLSSLSRLKNKGIGQGKTRLDHADVTNQLFASYAIGKNVKDLMNILGEDAVSDSEKLYVEFANEFESKFVSQSFETNRTIEQTLNLGWELLSKFPQSELKRIDLNLIEKFHGKVKRQN